MYCNFILDLWEVSGVIDSESFCVLQVLANLKDINGGK